MPLLLLLWEICSVAICFMVIVVATAGYVVVRSRPVWIMHFWFHVCFVLVWLSWAGIWGTRSEPGFAVPMAALHVTFAVYYAWEAYKIWKDNHRSGKLEKLLNKIVINLGHRLAIGDA